MFSFRKHVYLPVTLVLLSLALVVSAAEPGHYGYGKPATEDEIAGWDIDVRPDGVGLPPGSGSVEDGEWIYEDQCAECHGSFGEGVGRYPVLSGGEGSLTDTRPHKSVGSFWPHTSTLWDYIHRAMPFMQPESLSDDEVYAVTAYVLYLNDLVDDDFVLTQENLADIQLPNHGNFIPDNRPDTQNVRCMSNCIDPASIQIVSMVEPITRVDTATEEKADAQASGKPVYDQACGLCHNQGVGGAPAFADHSAWQPRIARGMESLMKNALEGYTGEAGYMPPKGGFTHLSDQDVKAAVDYLVEAAR